MEGATPQPSTETGPIGYELLLAYEVVSRENLDTRRAIRVTYKVGARGYEQVIRAGIVICPSQERQQDCQAAAQELTGS